MAGGEVMTNEERLKRADAYRGTPFKRLPGDPPQHKVLGALADGFIVRVSVVEMVWNDMLLMNAIEGDGTYEALYPLDDNGGCPQRQILELARKLYGAIQ